MKNLFLSALGCILFIFSSCHKASDIEYEPFQESKNGKWGLISSEGDVLFSDMLSYEPTPVYEGRFMLKGKNNMWQIYTAEKKPKRVGKEYEFATFFKNGMAFVAEDKGSISIINEDAEVVKKLDKIGEQEIYSVWRPRGGAAIFTTFNGLQGAIDEKGNLIIQPEYIWLYNWLGGKITAIHKDDVDNVLAGKDYKVTIFDTKGTKIGEINSLKYSSFAVSTSGQIIVCTEIQGKKAWGVLDDNGDYVLTPSTKFSEIVDFQNGFVIFKKGKLLGLKNEKGKTLIDPKYTKVEFDGDDKIRTVIDKQDETQVQYFLIDGKRIGNRKYVDGTRFYVYNTGYAFVKPTDKYWTIMNSEGEELKGLPDIYGLGALYNDNEVFTPMLGYKYKYMSSYDLYVYTPNYLRGLKFLQKKQFEKNVKVLDGGVLYEPLINGKGKVPSENSTVQFHCKVTLIDGTVLYNTFESKRPSNGRVNKMVKGLTIALTHMPVGSKWKIFVPQELAYGSSSPESTIPPYSMMTFEIELISCNN